MTFEVFAASLSDDVLEMRSLRDGSVVATQTYVGPVLGAAWAVYAALRHELGYAIVLHDKARKRTLLWHLTTEGVRSKTPAWSPEDGKAWVASLSNLLDDDGANAGPFSQEAFEIRCLMFDAMIEDRTCLPIIAEALRIVVAPYGQPMPPDTEPRSAELAGVLHKSLLGPRYMSAEYVRAQFEASGRKSLEEPGMHIFSFQMFSTLIPSVLDGEPFLRLAKGRYRRMSAAYFPRDGVAVGDANEWGGRESKLAALCARELLGVLVFRDDLARYLSQPIKALALQSYEYHIGHYLWNELSSIENVRKACDPALIAHIYVAGTQAEHYGDLEVLYPDWQGRVVRGATAADWLLSAFRDQEASFRPAGKFIPASLADRIVGMSMTSEAPMVQALDDLAKSLTGGAPGEPLRLMIGLRVENRCWLRQGEGYVALAQLLAKAGRKAVFVFDGHNVGGTARPILSATEGLKTGTESAEAHSLQVERGIVDQFREAIWPLADQIACFDTLGRPVSASIAACRWTDGFITHWGAGLAKFKWIVNARGLVFTSNHASTKNDFLLYDLPNVREAAIGSDYFPQSLVTDTDEKSELMNGRNFSGNFDIDPQAFAEECAAWIERRWPAERAPVADDPADKAGWMSAMRRLIEPIVKTRA
ncbi:hypothetical protein [Phenylobacterium immobile]|uniref:hypothetical protein n=1 Tax=Phenylobacterium immobile TaxID=21 RepID=UPI000AB35452|nr:hypothetical protein [Phenylobacterium immobile]